MGGSYRVRHLKGARFQPSGLTPGTCLAYARRMGKDSANKNMHYGRPASEAQLAVRWKPGQSGNPRGKPKGFQSQMRAVFGENGEALAEFLRAVLAGEKTAQAFATSRDGPVPVVVGPSIAEMLEAWKLAAGYAFGRPALAVELSGPEKGPIEIGAFDLSRLTDAETLAFAEAAGRVLEIREKAALPPAAPTQVFPVLAISDQSAITLVRTCG